jgi:hypothetical protein
MSRIRETQVRLNTGNVTNLEEVFNKRKVKRMPFMAPYSFTLASSSNFIVLSHTNNFPTTTIISRNAVADINSEIANQGGVVMASLPGAIGNPSVVTISDAIGNIINLVEIRHTVSNNLVKTPINLGEKQVYGLLQCASTVSNSDLVGSSVSPNVQMSFVYYNNSNTLTLYTLSDSSYEFHVNRIYQLRYEPVLQLEGGIVDTDVIDLASQLETIESKYTLTSNSSSNDTLNINTGAFSLLGSSTPSKDYTLITLPNNSGAFTSNARIQVYRNGVKQDKGVEVIWASVNSLIISQALEVGEVIEIIAPVTYLDN